MSKILRDLEHLSDLTEDHPDLASQAVELIVRLVEWLQESKQSQGLLIIIDEFGKFLEFAARNPRRSDLYVLQQLAEATARFAEPSFILVTILHQAFEQYAAGLRDSVRDEWAKIQGRFDDVAFQEPPEQILDLLALAIQHRENRFKKTLQDEGRQLAEQAVVLDLVPAGVQRQKFVQTLSRCAPLHPITALVLTRMCRKFGQHHRSLFAFLVSREPAGFSEFLLSEVAQDPFYRLPRLFDYIAENFGSSLSQGETATRWAEVQTALDRCRNSSPREIEIIKAVGLLSTMGVAGGIKPSREMLAFTLGHRRSDVEKACRQLTDDSILIYRRHTQSFALWQGSDVDLEAKLQEAQRKIPQAGSLAAKIAGLWIPRPFVAKRHSFQTGTLRYFPVRFSDLNMFSKVLERADSADGLIIYCLPNDQAEREMLIELAQSSVVRERLDILVAIPPNCDALKDAVTELERLKWIEENTAELQGDLVARRELRGRIAAAQERVALELQNLFAPSEQCADGTHWYHRGLPQFLTNQRSLSTLLSSICDAVYPHTPRLRNELINRRTLSSAAAAGRRNLIAAMLTNGGEEHLGIKGTPPEKSMYVSLLAATHIHRREKTGYVFGAPKGGTSIGAVWRTMEDFFSTCELQRRSVKDLFEELQKPPFGLKMGVIPVLFCAGILAHDTEVALYETHAFLPELTPEVFERLVHSPDKFQLRRYRVEGVRREVFRKLARLLRMPEQRSSDHLVAVVRPLYRFFNRLPAYVRQTANVSMTTAAVRDGLLNAKEPDVLLFDTLPRACGFEPFPPTQEREEHVGSFFEVLQAALAELQRSYDDLLSELRRLLFRVFDITHQSGREILRDRAQAISEHTVEPRLRAFILHLSEDQLNDVTWIESLASMVVGKSPRVWSDTDRARYEVSLSEVTRNFRHIESLVFELVRNQRSSEAVELLRIGITDRLSKELEAIVLVPPEQRAKLAEVMLALESCLDEHGVSDSPNLALASLGVTARKFLAELEKARPRQTEITAKELET
ncbi:MAG: hypothetical protein HY645_12340 [Acidobacteria bacterium]|nr:hypothetical protein [Acidobacteriota bacterium]